MWIFYINPFGLPTMVLDEWNSLGYRLDSTLQTLHVKLRFKNPEDAFIMSYVCLGRNFEASFTDTLLWQSSFISS